MPSLLPPKTTAPRTPVFNARSLRARPSALVSACVLVACALVACDHKTLDEEPKYGKTLPDSVEHVAGSVIQGPNGPMSVDQSSGMGGPMMGGGAAPMAGGMAAGGGAAATGGGVVNGNVTLADGVKDKVQAGSVLFVYARKAGMDKGPPLATAKFPADSFPVKFELSQANVMLQGLSFEGDINLSARLDNDGNPMTKNPGDLVGVLPNVKVGAENLTLELGEVLQ